MTNKSIDNYMAEDRDYAAETERTAKYYRDLMDKTDDPKEKERIRTQMIHAFNQAAYTRYDRAKAAVLQDVNVRKR